MNSTQQPPKSVSRRWEKYSLYTKLAGIGLIVFLLMIPNAFVKDLIHERNNTQQSVIREISDKWGHQQQIIGPVLTIPYKTYYTDKEGATQESINYCQFLPESLNINGNVLPERRKRGIYNAILYKTEMTVDGYFVRPDFEKLGIDPKNVILNEAYMQISIPEMSGINDDIILTYDGIKYRMEPGITKKNGFNSGIRSKLALDTNKKEMHFSFDLNLNGSQALTFGPIGKTTTVKLSSTWDSPSFMGSFLPDDHSVTSEGFTANWKILDLNRNYPQSWKGEQNLVQSLFGVELTQTVDQYSKSYRSARYALLIITLTFMVFFFLEIVSHQKVHPMHYILIGLAISIFYILLLSLSEHIGFNRSYLVSAVAIILLISCYATTILDTKKLALLLSIVLSVILGFIYVILQQEDYALLTGSIGLFVVLALVMYYSRNIQWDNIKKSVATNN